MFKVGDRVEGLSDLYIITSKGWRGVVVKVIAETHLQVRPLYGDEEDIYYVPAEHFKLIEPKTVDTFKVGDRVKMKDWESSVFRATNCDCVGTVVQQKEGGSFRVKWDDGEEWYYTPDQLIPNSKSPITNSFKS